MAWIEETVDVKILLAGDCGVGKSCLLIRFGDNIFIDSKVVLIGVSLKIRTIPVAGRPVKITAVESSHGKKAKYGVKTTNGGSLEQADAYVIMYDITEPKSLAYAKELIKKGSYMYPKDSIVTIVANKCDVGKMEQRVALTEAQVLAAQHGFNVVEVSAKNGTNVMDMFEDICQRVIQQKRM